MNAWRTEALPMDERPYRQFVWLSGERFHSGLRWRRDWWGLAMIRRDDAPDGRLGYSAEDIDRLEAEGDMDPGTAELFGWLPAVPPALLDMNVRDACKVNAAQGIEAATADETRSGSAEGESPVPEGNAPNLPNPSNETGEPE